LQKGVIERHMDRSDMQLDTTTSHPLGQANLGQTSLELGLDQEDIQIVEDKFIHLRRVWVSVLILDKLTLPSLVIPLVSKLMKSASI
jgi:hypothetical protein